MAKDNKGKKAQPQYYLSRINTQVLNYNVYVMNQTEKLLYTLVLFVIGGAVGLIFYGGLFSVNGVPTFATTISNIVVFVVVGLLANKFFMPILVESLRVKRIKKLRAQFCDFAASLTNSLGSGMNVRDSLLAVYNDLRSQYSDDAFIVIEVQEMINGMNNNFQIEEMLSDFGVRSGIPDIINFGIVFETCYRTGGDIKSIVRRTTEIISEKTIIAGEIETAITSNKTQMSVMNVLPIFIILMMRFMSPQFAQSFSTVLGVIGLTVAAVVFVFAYRMGQKIMDIKG